MLRREPMAKTDLRKTYKEFYNAGERARTPHLVRMPPLRYVMVDGTGDPNTSDEFRRAMEALYPVAYGVKFIAKADGADFGVMPLEGLWWTDPPEAFSMEDKGAWLWTVMILQPEWITSDTVSDALADAVKKGKVDAETAAKVRLATLEEGLSAQVLHIGPYDAEPPTIQALHGFVEEQGYRLRGKHHEIYLSDPRRVEPERMKTIIRHPVEKA
jgi:hypothetical protein